MPRILYIDIRTDEYFKLPGSIFTCPSVEWMSLQLEWKEEYERDIIEAESIDLPRIKGLNFYVAMITDDFINKLFLGCPVLEELYFSHCLFEMREISSPVLKKLTIDSCCLGQAIEISCPNVMSLDLFTWSQLDITLKNMTSLLAAKFRWEQMYLHQYPKLQLFSGLSNVENLSLYTIEPHILDFLLPPHILNYPTFNNLKRLEIGELDVNLHWNLVVYLLRHSPNLKTLILQFCQPRKRTFQELRNEELPEDASFQFEYLETVKIESRYNNAKLVEKVVHNLSAIVKSIGEVIIK